MALRDHELDPLDLEIIERVYDAVFDFVIVRSPESSASRREKQRVTLGRIVFRLARESTSLEVDALFARTLLCLPQYWDRTER